MDRGHNSIAVLGAEVDEAYQATLWRGISDEAENHSKRLVCFMGSRTGVSGGDNRLAYPFYRQAHSGNFDGIIVVSSTVSTYLSPTQVRSLFTTRPHIPKISIGLPIEGAGSVSVDGREGMEEIVRHMAVDHGRRRFALIAGPEWHPESEQRRLAIEKVLGCLNISIDRKLIIHGRFTKQSGMEAAASLLQERRDFDCLLCLNDLMAIGAIRKLSEQGIAVPETVAVCGFDGIEESAFCTPPLTTVTQPLYELGVLAVRELYRLMDGEAPRDLSLSCQPLIRQSCTCRGGFNTGFPQIKAGSLKTAASVDRGSLESLLSEDNTEAFQHEIDRILASSIFRAGDLSVLEELISEFEESLQPSREHWIAVFRNTEKRLWEVRTRNMVNERLQEKRRSHTLRNAGISLAGSFEFPALFKSLSEGLLQLGFSHAFLVMYSEDPDGGGDRSRLMFKMKDGLFIPGISQEFSGREVLPHIDEELTTRDSKTWMFSVLSFQDRALGYLILPGNHPDTENYKTLTKQVASSLQGAILLSQVRSHEKRLVRIVENRTEELTKANKHLLAEVAERKRLEQEVVDISRHTMERIGQDLHDDLCQHLASAALYTSALGFSLKDRVPESLEEVESIKQILADSINRTKRIVRGMVPLGIAEQGLSPALEILCREMAEASGMTIEYSGGADPCLSDTERSIEIYRIVQEAVNNGIKHSGAERIHVGLDSFREEDGDCFTVTVSDNGRGFQKSGTSRGMGLKIMKYRGRRAGVSVDISSTGHGTEVSCRWKEGGLNG